MIVSNGWILVLSQMILQWFQGLRPLATYSIERGFPSLCRSRQEKIQSWYHAVPLHPNQDQRDWKLPFSTYVVFVVQLFWALTLRCPNLRNPRS
jgi:hypothetical protein